MDLLANDASPRHQRFPCDVDVRRLRQQRKISLETGDLPVSSRDVKPKTVYYCGTSGDIAKLHKYLRGTMQNLAVRPEFKNGLRGNGIERVCQIGRQSYIPSLLTASLESETPLGAPSFRIRSSQSSRGVMPLMG